MIRSLFVSFAVAAAVVLGVAGWPGRAGAQDGAGRVPAPTLVAPASAAAAPDDEGFLRRWLLLEPIAVNGQLGDAAVRATVDSDYFPDQLTSMPSDGATVTVGGEPLTWHAVDTLRYNINLYHFAYALERPTSNVLFWAVTVIDAPREMSDVRLAIGSNAASIWWVNEEEAIEIFGDRQTVIDDGVSKRLTLREGRNVIRAAIVNAGGATDFCARFLDEANDPIPDLRIVLPGQAGNAARSAR
jgi:hypothetical protein